MVVDFLLKAGATVSGNPSSGWGFDITAQRIGFADEVSREEQRKAQVLKLLIEAEAKEHKSQEEQSAAASQPLPTSTRDLMGSPAELAGPADGSARPRQQPYSEQKAARSGREGASPSELDTRVRSPSASMLKDEHQPITAYPTPSHIANAFGFDPFPQQRVSNEGPRPSGTTSDSPSGPKSVVHVGPDGMWRLNPILSTQAVDGATSIYEMALRERHGYYSLVSRSGSR